ncbi:MAG TPA: M81 family metallopeptidase [Caldilineaceae bacterium]|nr:M81 family metallopeptidase [Caldilineaceae bacterium]
MRIAIAEVGQETCSFTPVRTTVDTFRQYGLYEGDEVIPARRRGRGVLAGFFDRAEEEKIDLVPFPIISGWAGANGMLTPETLAFFEEKVVAGLSQLDKLDGLFFSLHGAAAAENDPDVEGALLAAARRVVGPDLPIVAPFDHHGNVTQRMIANLNGLVAHRTQPHDPYDTGYLAAKQLFAIIRGEIKPTMAWHKIPMITHQEQFLTSRGPMKRWFDRAREMETAPGVVAVSPFPIQPWLDVPEGGWTTVVVTDDDPALAQKLSAELAQMAWEMREEFWVYESVPPAEAIRQAVASNGLVILSDTGDSVFGGATGDSTVLLREMLTQGITKQALVPLVDPEVAALAHGAGVGATLDVKLGGKLDPLFGKPVQVKAKVAALADGVLEADVIGRTSFDMGQTALLEIGSIRVVVSEHVGIGGNHPVVYRRFEIEPAAADMVVLKTASNWQYYLDMATQVIRADTDGPTMSHLERFDWQQLPRPCYGLDSLTNWQAV